MDRLDVSDGFDPITDWIDHEPPRRRDLLRDVLPLGRVGFIAGARAIGKSQFVLQLAVSVATGTPLCGHWPIDESGGVLALFAEDDAGELRRRLWHIRRTLTPEFDGARFLARLRRNLQVASVTDQDTTLSIKWGRGVRWTDYLEELIGAAQRIERLKLIVLDPINRFRDEKDQSNAAISRLLDALEHIVAQTGATVLTVQPSHSSVRSATTLAEDIRWQMNLTAMSEAQARRYRIAPEQRGHYLRVAMVKNSYAPPAADSWLRRDRGGFLSIANPQS